MTNRFAATIIGAVGAAVLMCVMTSSSGAQTVLPISMSASAESDTRVLFFDVHSASLSPVAKAIVLSTVDAAERSHANQIEIAAYAADDESARDSGLAARRAAIVKQQIANFGFRGSVVVDEEGPESRLAGLVDPTIDRRVVLRVGG